MRWIGIITGATSGIGLETAALMLEAGMAVTCIGRSVTRGKLALERLRARVPGCDLDFEAADLSSIAATRALGIKLAQKYPRIDVLVNNAGALFDKRKISPDGLEMTFALNHMAYFTLTRALLASLHAVPAGRVVNVASASHYAAVLNFADLQMEHTRYSGLRAYQQSKLANVLFTTELARRLSGSKVSANCLHPGFVASRFGSDNGPLWRALFRTLQLFAISPGDAARAVAALALAPEFAGVSGEYFNRDKRATPSLAARNSDTAARLWEVSERLVDSV